jgi:hypothetical protein
MQSLYKRIYRPSKTASFFSVRPTSNTIWQLGSAELGRVLQSFQKAFTPLGDLTLFSNPIQLFKMKVDESVYPDDIAETWAGFLEGEGVNRSEWPFVRWMIEEHILPKIQEDYEMNEVFAGVYKPPTPGTPGAAGASMDGILKLQNDLVSKGKISPIVNGTAPTTDEETVEYVESFIDKIDSKYRKLVDCIFMSEELELQYRRGKENKYNTNYAQAPDLDTVKHFPNARVVGLPSHNGSSRIWTSLPAARVRPIKKAALANALKVESVDRNVKMFTDWSEGLGFALPAYLFINDQELATV